MKRKLLLLSIVQFVMSIIYFSMGSFAGASFTDVAPNANYLNAVSRMSALKIIVGDEKGLFRPNSYITREQFIKIVVRAMGQEKDAEKLSTYSSFKDISVDRWSNGYINQALSQGYISGITKELFSPESEITYAQACAIVTRAMNYSYLVGAWPNNYINAAGDLGLTNDMLFEPDEKFPRWATAVLADKLWFANMKINGSGSLSTGFLAQVSDDIIVLDNNVTSTKIQKNQILTDKGVFYVLDKENVLELGQRYRVFIYNDSILKVVRKINDVREYSVRSASETEIIYKDVKGNESKFQLPLNLNYYYNGTKITFETLKTILGLNSYIVLGFNQDGNDLEYGVVYDAIFSDPEVVDEQNMKNKKIGDINITEEKIIIKDNKIIDIAELEPKEVLYNVTDVKGDNGYVLVIDNKISGKITDIKPNKLAPQIIQVNGTDYNLSEDFNLNKLNASPGSFKIDSFINLLLGNNGKAVDIYQNRMGVAVVLNFSSYSSTDKDDFGKKIFTAKLLFSEGNIATMKVDKDVEPYKGSLVLYKPLDDGTLIIDYAPITAYPDLIVDKDERTINGEFVADNIKVLNFINNVTGQDVTVNVLDFDDLKNGKILAGKVRYFARGGNFNDVSVLFLDDVFDQRFKLSFVKENIAAAGSASNTVYTYNMMVDEATYSFKVTRDPLKAQGVYKVWFENSQVKSIIIKIEPKEESKLIEEIDITRVKINGKVYRLKDNVSIYLIDKSGDDDEVSVVDIENIDTKKRYENVQIYLDKEGIGGRVEIIVITEMKA